MNKILAMIKTSDSEMVLLGIRLLAQHSLEEIVQFMRENGHKYKSGKHSGNNWEHVSEYHVEINPSTYSYHQIQDDVYLWLGTSLVLFRDKSGIVKRDWSKQYKTYFKNE